MVKSNVRAAKSVEIGIEMSEMKKVDDCYNTSETATI